MGASKKVLITETSGGGYSEKVAAENALLVSGDATAGQVPIVQEDGSVEWDDPAAGSSKWEADGEDHIKPTDGKLVKAENIDELPDGSLWEQVGDDHIAPKNDMRIKAEIIDDLPDPDTLKTYSGFENRDDTALSMNSGTGVFSLLMIAETANVFTNGTKHILDVAQTVTVTEDKTITYIYVDNDGVLKKALTPWNLTSGLVAPCAIVFKDGTNYAVTDERHSYERNKNWHNWAHHTIGAMYKSGLTGTFDASSLSIAQGVIADEDIIFDTGGTKTATTLWYRDGASGMRMVRNSAAAFATVDMSGTPGLAYDNNGTLASVGGNAYATNWIYASNDPVEPIYTVVSQATYPSLNQARNATLPIINLSTAEWKLIYKVIYRRTTPDAVETINFIEATDFRNVQTGVPTSPASPADHAQLINRDAANAHPASAMAADATQFTKNLSGTDTDVQTALETLDQLVAGGGGLDESQFLTLLEIYGG